MLKVGVLGAGHLGRIHLKLLQQSEKYELVGFYDPDIANGQRVAEEFKYRYFDQLDALMYAVDVVDIVTPTLSHYNCAIKAKPRASIFLSKNQLPIPSKKRNTFACWFRRTICADK